MVALETFSHTHIQTHTANKMQLLFCVAKKPTTTDVKVDVSVSVYRMFNFSIFKSWDGKL